MKTLTDLYSIRDAAKACSTNPTAARIAIIEHDIPYTRVGNAIVIDGKGLKKLRGVFEARRAELATSA